MRTIYLHTKVPNQVIGMELQKWLMFASRGLMDLLDVDQQFYIATGTPVESRLSIKPNLFPANMLKLNIYENTFDGLCELIIISIHTSKHYMVYSYQKQDFGIDLRFLDRRCVDDF